MHVFQQPAELGGGRKGQLPWLSACHTAWSPLPVGLGGRNRGRGPEGPKPTQDASASPN